MSTANSSASKEVVTAGSSLIGSKILSGRTKDQNIGYVAECLADRQRTARARHPARMGKDDRRRDERGASAHDAHPNGADLISTRCGGAWAFGSAM